MNGPEPYAEVRRWVRFAGEDLRTAVTLLAQENTVPRHACWGHGLDLDPEQGR